MANIILFIVRKRRNKKRVQWYYHSNSIPFHELLCFALLWCQYEVLENGIE